MKSNYFLFFNNTTVDDWREMIRNYSLIKNDIMHDIKEKSKNHYERESVCKHDLFKQLPSFDLGNSHQLVIMMDVLHEFLNNER